MAVLDPAQVTEVDSRPGGELARVQPTDDAGRSDDKRILIEMQQGSWMTTTLLAFLRRHNWIGPSLIFVTIGIRSVMNSKFPYIPFWAGVTCFLCALLFAWATERANRARRTKRRLGDGEESSSQR